MDISYRWLADLAPGLDVDVEEVARRLAARGAPVEGITALAESIGDVVVARVDAVRPHPDADRLSLCTVDAGAGGALQVVCGAPNVKAGGMYPFAPVGATLPGDLTIGEAEIRGQASAGMLCSPRELGLGHDHAGLLELDADLAPGASFVEALRLDDWRLEVEVTSNRGDLLSHVGIAREVAPGGQVDLVLPAIPGGGGMPGVELVQGEREADVGAATVRVEDPDLCGRYLGAVVRGVTVGPSPAWLQGRLRAAGARPINNVVDATNYVLLELGQPLHAFDLATLEDRVVVVRRAREGETLTTLDGEDRKVTPDMLMICDAERPVAIAGVMGGLDTEVTAGTTDVLLECAWFEPRQVRATRRALNMSTDASYRFERWVDPEGMETALRRALEIIVATAGGALEPRVADAWPRRWERPTLKLRASRVEQVLGVAFRVERIQELLEPLGFETRNAGEGVLDVVVPGYRGYDVTREIDLVEEVARTHGFDAFPQELAPFRPGTVPDHPLFALEDALRDRLVGQGLFEAHTLSLVPRGQGEVELVNPVSTQEAALRSRVVPSLLRRVEHNWARGTEDVRLFELATAFSAAAGDGSGQPREEPRLAAAITGRRAPVHFSGPGAPVDLWDLKALLEEAAGVAWPDARVEPGEPCADWVDESSALVVRIRDGDVVGGGGRVRTDAVDTPRWAGDVFALELALPAEPAARPAPVFRPPPAFPPAERDLALLVPHDVEAARVEEGIRAAGGSLLRDLRLFDLYVGPGIPEDRRSLAWALRFQSAERTLTDEDVDGLTAAIVENLRETLGVEPRG
ncbi:MAG: phenylalanine--tRNA ligase subunit beta [Gemmatimonadetes bacterium]|nr:phenylalanine--tRNA ligase subunit beta [Gemmatimonadota bacterium]